MVVNHVTQTLGEICAPADYSGDIYFLAKANADPKIIMLMLLQGMGSLGNAIFFICTAWFLVGKKGYARKKAFSMLCTVWFISIFVLGICFIFYPETLSTSAIVRHLFPTTFKNNWYTTCYIVFLFIYPWLNKIIETIDQRQLLRIVMFTGIIWIFGVFLLGECFFSTSLTLWVAIYFLIAYVKIYCTRVTTSVKAGIVLLTVGIIGYILQVLVTDYVGLYISDFFGVRVLRWSVTSSPFYIMLTLGALIISLHAKFKNRFINYVSSLSMFIYLFHENSFGYCMRYDILKKLFERFGKHHVVLIDIGFSAALFIFCAAISFVYKETIQKAVKHISDKLYLFVARAYNYVENKIIAKDIQNG